MQWSHSALSRFEDLEGLRDQQMRELEALLIEPSHRIVNVHGAPGSGKTALANLFWESHRDSFPGGVSIIHGSSSVGEDEIVRDLSGDRRSLLVLDEVDRVPLPILIDAFARIRGQRPRHGVLTTSNTPVFVVGKDTHLIQMPPLSPLQILDLLEKQTGASKGRLEELTHLLAGNALAAGEASHRLASGMPPERIVEWLESGPLASAWDSNGKALSGDSPKRAQLDLAVHEISDALIEELAAQPELLYKLDPRKFEKLVAELYRRRGFEATLTPASGDEGVDIYVVSRSDLGRTLWVVQAKRYAAHNRVEAGVVRELYGTVMAKDASAGILVTTSFFQPGATRLERKLKYRLNLKDYLDLQEMLRRPRDD